MVLAFLLHAPASLIAYSQDSTALLELIRENQRTNSQLFPRGAFKATISWDGTNVRNGKPAGRWRNVAATNFTWLNDNTSGTFEISTSTSEQETNTIKSGRYVQRGSQMTFYDVSAKSVEICDVSQAHIISEVRDLRPPQLWFSRKTVPWADLLGANPARVFKHIMAYDATIGKGAEIVLDMKLQKGTVFQVVVSSAQGGNIVRYECLPKKGLGYRGEYEWREHSNGVFVLSQHKETKYRDANTRNEVGTYSLRIDSFDDAPKISDTTFTFEALGVPANTPVNDQISGTRYTYNPSQAGSGVDEKILRKLGEVIKQRGFLVPK